MGLNIESKVETAWKTLIAAESYITAQSIPVYSFHDNSHSRPQKCVVVKAETAKMEIGPDGDPGPIFSCPVEIVAITYIADDLNRAILDAIYQACLGVVNSATRASLAAATSGISFAAIEHTGGQEGTEDNYQALTIQLNCIGY